MKRITIFILIICLLILSAFFFYKNTDTESKVNTIKEVVEKSEIIENVQQAIAKDYLQIENLKNYPFNKDGEINIERTLEAGSNYNRYIASYISEGSKVFGLLTIPFDANVENKYPAVVFNHGYIPPDQYVTDEKYIAYVDTIARSGFIVFKPDFRGWGSSEGNSQGTYFSPDITIDIINAKNALKSFEVVSDSIHLWGHSMSGNAVLRTLLVDNEFKSGVIWGGAVYSYYDFNEYGITDSSFNRDELVERIENEPEMFDIRKTVFEEVDKSYISKISLTENLTNLTAPIQIHHSTNDDVVDIKYSIDLAKELEENNKEYELIEYGGGGHNISSPYFEQAINNTIEFYNKYK